MGGTARTHDAVTAEPRLRLVSECGGGLGEGGRVGALAHAAFARGPDATLIRGGLGDGEGRERERVAARGAGAGRLMEGVGRGGACQRLLLSKRCAGAPPPPHARAASTRRHTCQRLHGRVERYFMRGGACYFGRVMYTREV